MRRRGLGDRVIVAFLQLYNLPLKDSCILRDASKGLAQNDYVHYDQGENKVGADEISCRKTDG